MTRIKTNLPMLVMLAGAAIVLVIAVGLGMARTYATSANSDRLSPLNDDPGDAQFTLGEDEVICLGYLATIIGTMGDDVLTGTGVEADSGDRVLAASGSVEISFVRHAVASAFSASAWAG